MFWGGIWISCNFIVLSWVYLAFKKPSQRFDERDLLIYKRAVLIAFSLMWVYFVTASVYICWKFGAMGDISANLLLLVVFGGLALFMLTHSSAILVQYGKGNTRGQEN